MTKKSSEILTDENRNFFGEKVKLEIFSRSPKFLGKFGK